MTDWLPELSDDDLDTLGQALEAWELKDSAGEMLGDVIEMMVLGGDERERAAIKQQRGQQKLQRQRDQAQRKERSVLLRAKLLTLRDRRRVERVANG